MDNNFNLNNHGCYNSKYYNTINCLTDLVHVFSPCNLPNPSIYKPSIEYQVAVPINLAKF